MPRSGHLSRFSAVAGQADGLFGYRFPDCSIPFPHLQGVNDMNITAFLASLAIVAATFSGGVSGRTARAGDTMIDAAEKDFCIDTCNDCVRACRECLLGCDCPHCEKHCLTCIETCRACVALLELGSPLAPEMCGLCEEACEECAEKCGECGDMPCCKACAAACMKCHDACEAIAGDEDEDEDEEN